MPGSLNTSLVACGVVFFAAPLITPTNAVVEHATIELHVAGPDPVSWQPSRGGVLSWLFLGASLLVFIPAIWCDGAWPVWLWLAWVWLCISHAGPLPISSGCISNTARIGAPRKREIDAEIGTEIGIEIGTNE
jgi:hypothetical protein